MKWLMLTLAGLTQMLGLVCSALPAAIIFWNLYINWRLAGVLIYGLCSLYVSSRLWRIVNAKWPETQ